MKTDLDFDSLITPWRLFSQFYRHHEDIAICNLLQKTQLTALQCRGRDSNPHGLLGQRIFLPL